MDRLSAHHLEVANESVTEVGTAAVPTSVSLFPSQTLLSHYFHFTHFFYDKSFFI
jgi:hypothetical protein